MPKRAAGDCATSLKLLGDKPGCDRHSRRQPDRYNLQKRVNGAKEELTLHKHLELKDVYYHKETPQDSFAEIESVQKANPEINGWAMTAAGRS